MASNKREENKADRDGLGHMANIISKLGHGEGVGMVSPKARPHKTGPPQEGGPHRKGFSTSSIAEDNPGYALVAGDGHVCPHRGNARIGGTPASGTPAQTQRGTGAWREGGGEWMCKSDVARCG